MENLLNPVVFPNLTPQHMELLLQQLAHTDASLNRRNGAFKEVVGEVQTTREDAERFREKAKYLQLDVARTDAHLVRTREALLREQKVNAELRRQLKTKDCDQCRKMVEGDNEEKTRSQSKEADMKTRQRLKLKTGEDSNLHTKVPHGNHAEDQGTRRTEPAEVKGNNITYEIHENLMRKFMQMRQEMSRLAKEKGEDVDKIMEAAEYKDIIKRLQKDVQDKVDENETLRERLNNLSSKDDGQASQVVGLQFQNDKLSKRLALSQVMVDTLSKHHDEVKAELERLCRQNEPVDEGKQVTDDSKVFVPIKSGEEETEKATKGNNPQYEEKIDLLEKQVQGLNAKLKRWDHDNKQLFKERNEAEKQREIYEDRYNKLMETLHDIQQRNKQCSNCQTLKEELDKLQVECNDLKEVNELIRAQMKLFEEDLRQEQLDSANMKQRNNFHIEQWKKNCQRMGQQVDLLSSDLKREHDAKQKLQYQLNYQRSRSAPGSQRSMAANLHSLSHQPHTFQSPVSSPWQEHYNPLPSEVVVDGPMDVPDSVGGLESPSSTRGSRPSPPSVGEQMLECPRCKREFPRSQEKEYMHHAGKCLDCS